MIYNDLQVRQVAFEYISLQSYYSKSPRIIAHDKSLIKIPLVSQSRTLSLLLWPLKVDNFGVKKIVTACLEALRLIEVVIHNVLTVPSMHLFSLTAPQHPRNPTSVTNEPAAIRILADTE